MKSFEYLGRQPILNSENDIIAYDLFYKDEQQLSDFDNPRFATSSVLVSVLNKFGVKNIVGSKKAFIKTDESFLMHDLIFTIPSEMFSLSLMCITTPNERHIERLEQLKERGFSVGINDVSVDNDLISNIMPVIHLIEFIKIDTIFSDSSSVEDLLKMAKAQGITTIATKIETQEMYQHYKALGCDAFQGYYFSKPTIVESAVIDPSKMAVFTIYQRLLDESDISEIITLFEENHAITLQLLQYVNSAVFHFKKSISTIKQVITLIGRKPLAQWLLMSIYSKSLSSSESNSALLLQVKMRTELMKALMHEIDASLESEAYFVGVLSLMPTLFSMSLNDILTQLHVDDTIKDALLLKKGILGEAYQCVIDTEYFYTNKIDHFCERHNISSEVIEKIMADSIHSVNELDEAV